MSYILDALQRADAERERGRVPGLQSQLMPAAKLAPGRDTLRKSGTALAVLLALLCVLAATAHWQGLVNTQPEPPQISTPDRLTPAAPQPAEQSSEQTNWLPSPPILAPARPAIAPISTSAPSATSTPSAASTPPDVPGLDELTPEARSQLPAFHVSGSTYSQNPALRTLIANGNVVQEGQNIAPGLQLERIDPRTAVLDHQGLRFSIRH